jgi:hypothetical protein
MQEDELDRLHGHMQLVRVIQGVAEVLSELRAEFDAAKQDPEVDVAAVQQVETKLETLNKRISPLAQELEDRSAGGHPKALLKSSFIRELVLVTRDQRIGAQAHMPARNAVPPPGDARQGRGRRTMNSLGGRIGQPGRYGRRGRGYVPGRGVADGAPQSAHLRASEEAGAAAQGAGVSADMAARSGQRNWAEDPVSAGPSFKRQRRG